MLRKDNAELRATVRELQPAGSAHYGALFRVRFEELEGRDVIAAWTGAEVLAERSSLEDP